MHTEMVNAEVENATPYKRLAIIYRKQKDCESEIAVLREAIRVRRLKQLPGAMNRKFSERLQKAMALRDKAHPTASRAGIE